MQKKTDPSLLWFYIGPETMKDKTRLSEYNQMSWTWIDNDTYNVFFLCYILLKAKLLRLTILPQPSIARKAIEIIPLQAFKTSSTACLRFIIKHVYALESVTEFGSKIVCTGPK